MADILDFPSRAKPRVTDADALLFGEGSPSNVTPYGETLEEFSPRPHFGLRPATGEALFNIPRAEDKAEQETFKQEGRDRIKRAALSAAEAAALGSRKHICPTLDANLSARIGHVAQQARQLGEEARLLGHTKACVTLRDIESILETVSAEIDAAHLPEGA